MSEPALRSQLTSLLRLELKPVPRLLEREIEKRAGWVIERLVLDMDGPVPAVLTRPAAPGPHAAVLYCHAHGGRPEIGRHELLEGRPAILSPYGPVLAAEKLVTLCVDMPCFGGRTHQKENALAKALLWRGDSLYGLMLRELSAALDYLAARNDVDPARMATLGLSMGALHAFWLAALDPRVARTAHLCCLADIETLVELDAHDRHGLYLLVPGLLRIARTGEIAGLVAPRPQLVTIGADDLLTPEPAVRRVMADARIAYGDSPALQLHLEEGVGHQETLAMRAAVLAFLREL